MIKISCDISQFDLDAFCNLENNIPDGWTKGMLMDAMNRGSSHFLKAEDEGQTVGYINYSIIFDEAEINGVAILDSYRRIGIGQKLVAELIKVCSIKGVGSIFLEVNENNMPAIKLYEKCGFKFVCERKNYYGKDSALIYKIMIKE